MGKSARKSESVYYALNSNGVKPNDYAMYLAEFRFPNAQADTWVLTRRHFAGHVEVGNPTDSRGGKVFNFVPIESSQFNVKGFTGRIKPFTDTR